MNRRQFTSLMACLALGAAPARRRALTLGFSTYGMPGWSAERAVDTIAEAGFDSFELCLLPTYDSAPGKLTGKRRRDLRRRFRDVGLSLPAVMESLTPSADKMTQALIRERLKQASQMARDLCPDQPPLVETVLGGGEWGKVRTLFRDQLGDWLTTLDGITLAIKPHRFGAMSLPEHALWLIDQVKSPRLKMVFDQSHYEGRGVALDDLLKATPHVAFVAVKDTVVKEGKTRFALPGETGTPDHLTVLRGLVKRGYTGDINCEVSGMVSSAPGYDARRAARLCYEKLSGLYEAVQSEAEK